MSQSVNQKENFSLSLVSFCIIVHLKLAINRFTCDSAWL